MASDLYSLTLEDREDYLYACVQAEHINLGIAVQYINETMAHLRETGATKMLFVRETPGMASATEYQIASSVIVNMIPRNVQVALVDRSPTHKIVVKIINAEAKQKNRDIRAFEDFDEAEAWLMDRLA